MYDVLATLYRSGEPFELTAGALVRQSMVTTGAITDRVDRLEQRGLVERSKAADRRQVVVRLTPQGHQVLEAAILPHLAVEREILAALTPREQDPLALLLRATLLGLVDTAEQS